MDKQRPIYRFSSEKNKKLIAERGISFDEIIAALDNDQLIEIIEHPNKQKYPGQEIYIIQMRDYIYFVPFVVEQGDTIFLKTIFASRKAKKQYLK